MPAAELSAREGGAPSGAEGDVRGALAEALALARRVDLLLSDPRPELERENGSAFRMRLARAHVLGLIDQLAEIVGPRARPKPARPKPST